MGRSKRPHWAGVRHRKERRNVADITHLDQATEHEPNAKATTRRWRMSRRRFEGVDDPIDDFIANLENPVPAWDLALIGDGSGTEWDGSCGWAVTAVVREPRQRVVLYGGMNLGTVPIAETMPYIHALLWYCRKDGPLSARQKLLGKAAPTRVVIITDNQYVAEHGEAIATGGRTIDNVRRNVFLWAAIDAAKHENLQLYFRWIDRESMALNQLADTMAGIAHKEHILTPAQLAAVQQSMFPDDPREVTIHSRKSQEEHTFRTDEVAREANPDPSVGEPAP